MRALLITAVLGGACAQLGGYTPITDIGQASKIHKLAAFSLDALQTSCTTSNNLVCGRLMGTSLVHVLSAKSQVVSGMNFEIVCEVSVGTLTLRVYEQLWSKTLILREASLTAHVNGASFARVELGDAIDHGEPLILDDKAFRASLLTESTSAECTGGAVWNDCASPCTKTCAEPAPMCMAMCVSQCECPRWAPILKGGRCVDEAECSPAPRPACVPNPNAPCPRIYRPVCADGTTYANSCLAEADCKVYTKGQCVVERSRG